MAQRSWRGPRSARGLWIRWYHGFPQETPLRRFDDGPVSSNVTVLQNPVKTGLGVPLTAFIDDGTTGGSAIATAEYTLDHGVTWLGMDPVDGAFNDAAEEVTAALGPFIDPSVMDVCVRGVDARGNMGLPSCVMIAVFDPTGGFATGAGWIESPRGAFVSAGDLVGKAHFAFVSKYAKGKTIPDGRRRRSDSSLPRSSSKARLGFGSW